MYAVTDHNLWRLVKFDHKVWKSADEFENVSLSFLTETP